MLHSTLLLPIYALLATAAPFKRGSSNDPKEYLVSPLPGWNELQSDYAKPIQYAGQLELFAENNTDYFFWKVVDSEKIPENKNRTTFWLQGGPGCSSLEAVFAENGPFKLNEQRQITVNEASWHKVSDMVYVDQPPMVGYSDGELIRNLYQVQVYFMRFLEKYFALFPDDLQNDIYIAGESYGGQYIPYVADAILKRNQNLTDGQNEYKLKGLLIGNGLVAPDEQSLSYVDWFKEKSLIDDSNPKWSDINDAQKACQDVVDGKAASPNENYAFSCRSILSIILDATKNETAPTDQQCVNMYDFQLRDSYPSCGSSYPPVNDITTPYLNDSGIQHDLNVQHPVNFSECSTVVQHAFTAANSPPAKELLPDIVSQIPVVLYNGDLDIICNTNGVLKYLSNTTWNGATGFNDVDNKSDWVVEGKKAGWVLQERDLTLINVFNASHLVPYTQPIVSRYLFDFVTNEYTKNNGEFISVPKEEL